MVWIITILSDWGLCQQLPDKQNGSSWNQIWPRGAFCNTFDLKPPFVIKIFVLSIFEWPFYTGFTQIADLFLFCYEWDFKMSLSDEKQADIIDALNTTSRYLDDILKTINVYFDNIVSQIYPSELQLNNANTSDTQAAFLDLNYQFLMILFLPKFTSYGVYISQLIRFARASSYVADFNTRNKLLTQKHLKQSYRYHKLCKTFSKFYRRYYDLISKFQVGLRSLAIDFRNLNSMVTWCINWRRVLALK